MKTYTIFDCVGNWILGFVCGLGAALGIAEVLMLKFR